MSGVINTIIYFILSLMITTGASTVIEDTPAEAVEKYFADLAAGDQQIVQEFTDRDDLIAVQKDATKNAKVKVKEARTKGDVAVARVKITNRDFSGVKKDYLNASYKYVMDNLYAKDIGDKQKLADSCMKLYQETVAKAADSDSKVTSDVFIGMERNSEGDWEMVPSEEARIAIMGGLELPNVEEKTDLREALRLRAVDHVLKQEEIPAYSYDQVQAMDMSKPSGVTVEDLKLVTRGKLVGTEEKLYEMEQNYNLNCLLLLGIASHESAYGTMQFHPNNVCGYGYSGFSSINECLDTVGRVLAKNYLDPSGPYYKGTTIDSVNRTYAADPAWDSKVANKITYFYKVISENHNKQLEKLK